MDSLSTPSASPESAPKSSITATLLPAVADLGVPVFVFGVVFLLLTLGVTALLSPDRFPIKAGSSVIRLSELSAEHTRLVAEQETLTQEREELLKSQDEAPVLSQVSERQKEIFPIGSVLLSVEELRSSFATPNFDPISLPTIDYSADLKTLTLGGLVTDPTGGSSHLLSSFVDGLRSLPNVASVSEPEYIQQTNDQGMPTTPFTLTLRFTDAR